jgi:cytochrome c peroxidase
MKHLRWIWIAILLGVTVSYLSWSMRAHGAETNDTAAREAGRAMYFDPRLSEPEPGFPNGTTSCADCHQLERGLSDGRKLAVGRIGSPASKTGFVGVRRSPAILNAAYRQDKPVFWDLRTENMTAQATQPLANNVEMAVTQTAGDVANRLNAIDGYRALMQAAFGDPQVTVARMQVCLVAFEGLLVAADTPLTRWHNGQAEELTEAETRVATLFFGKAHCSECHPPPLYTTGNAANTGVELAADTGDVGLEKTTGQRKDRRAFKIPGLVAVGMRQPFLTHAGAMDLKRLVAHYGSGGRVIDENGQPAQDRFLDDRIRDIRLSAREQADFVSHLPTILAPYDYPQAAKIRPKELPR